MQRPYKGQRFLYIIAAAACSALTACGHGSTGGFLPHAAPQRHTGAQTYTSGSTSLTITPNYAAGFGPKLYGGGSTYGNLPPGPSAATNSGAVDFGYVEQSEDYLYTYAVQLQVVTANGFSLYAEANSDLQGSGTLPVRTHLFWEPTVTSNGTDTNTTYSTAATPFAVNTSPGNGATPAVYSSTSTSVTLGYDFVLRVGPSDAAGAFSTDVTYTVVAK
jgi:hypothetical protein